MRSAIVAAAFAAGVLAVPLMERDVVYETELVYATAYVTVTAGDSVPTDAPAPSSSSSKSHWGHKKPAAAWTKSWATTWTSTFAPEPTSVQEQASAYSSSEEQASAYSSSEEQTPAPSSYEAPQSSYESTPTSSEEQVAASSAPASSASAAKATDYQSIVLHHHNIHRSNHSAAAVTWNQSLADTAEKIGQLCSYEHMMTMDGGGYGQNIAAGVKADNVSAVITELFYNGEINAYGDNYGKSSTTNPAFDDSSFEEWGHMTQIVWQGTTSIGCATVDCSSTGLAQTSSLVAPYFTVCNYYGPGNMVDAYDVNVLAPRGDATCYWNDGL